jgi:hypothetical protein
LFVCCAAPHDEHALINGDAARLKFSAHDAKKLFSRLRHHGRCSRVRRSTVHLRILTWHFSQDGWIAMRFSTKVTCVPEHPEHPVTAFRMHSPS